MSDEQTLEPTNVLDLPKKNKGGRPKGAKTDPKKLRQAALERRKRVTTKQTAEILTLTVQGLPNTVIGQHLDLHPTTIGNVQKSFESFFSELQNVEQYRQVKSQLLDSIEIMLLKSLSDPEKHSKATLAQCAFAFDKLYMANRLEADKSTVNVNNNVRFTSVDLSSVARKGTR